MPASVAPLFPVLVGLAVLWAGAAVVLHAGGRMSGREAPWEVVVGSALTTVGSVLPELGIAVAVSAWSAIGTEGGSGGGLVVGAVLGSVLARATLAVGLGTLLGAAAREPAAASRRPPLFLVAVILVAALALDGTLGRVDGAVLLTPGLLHLARRVRATMRASDGAAARYGLLPDPFVILVGLASVAAAAWLLTPRALTLASSWGVAPMLVGLLVLGVGASLPELVLGLDAATRGRPQMSASSALTSGTLGLLVPLGLAALVAPLAVEVLTVRLDLPAVALVATALWLLDRREVELTRGLGGLLVATFLAYAAIRIVMTT